MATVRTVRRGGRTYYYAVHSYRRGGRVRQRIQYLGTARPIDPERSARELERSVWAETWFQDFDRLASRYRARRASVPRSVDEKDLDTFAILFTYDTNRIEGSTLNLRETRDVVERGITPRSKPISDSIEARRHATLASRLLKRPQGPSLVNLLKWHRFLFGDSKADIAGRIRTYEVSILGSRHRPPPGSVVRRLMEELDAWARGEGRTLHPVEFAAEFHLRFESIHPFGDGNGRVGRLALNSILARSGYPPVNIRFEKRQGYYHALERASIVGDSRPFLLWFFRYYLRNVRVGSIE